MGPGHNSHAISIHDWLEVSRESRESDHEDESPLHQGPGLATALYSLCSQQLSRLAAIWPFTRRSALDRRRSARLADIRAKLAAFADSFEDGRLESCLNVDDELRTSILTLLHDVGNVLQRGK